MRAFAVLLFFLQTTWAHAECDASVRRLRTNHLGGMTLCELQERYQKALSQLSQKGIANPKHIGNVYGPRFINMPDWKNYLNKNGDSEFAAWKVLKPAPKTWENWSRAAAIVDGHLDLGVFANGSTDDIRSWLLSLHEVTMGRLLPKERVGKFRSDVAEIIPLHSIRDAYSDQDVKTIENTPYLTHTGQKLMTFESRMCDDLTQHAVVYKNHRFRLTSRNTKETVKVCGDLTMAAPEEVEKQIQLWASFIKAGFQNLRSESASLDIIAFSAKAQQWLIVIHPFIDGNGRISRFAMDSIFNYFNLPPPVLDDMNRDFFANPDEWADAIGKGLVNTVTALELCAQNPDALGCKEVSDQSPESLKSVQTSELVRPSSF